MISILTPDGSKGLILRGVLTPAGLKAIEQASITTPSGDKQFWDGAVSGLTVSASREVVQGAQGSGSTIPVSTISTTAIAAGGSAPFTYAWTLISDDGNGGTWGATAPSNATSAFRASLVSPLDASDAVFRCTVTDARGATGSVDVSATARNYGNISGGGIEP